MPTILVTCPDCGEQKLTPAGVHLTVFDAGNAHYYEFFCPGCYELVAKPAPEEVQNMLFGGGVDHTFEHVPLEALESHGGPPLTVEDLMDFTVALRNQSRTMLESARQESNLHPSA